ncbi:MAG: iron ABC transporter permease, partial [Micropruina sp.]
MIRTLLALLPADSRGRVVKHLALTVLGVVLRAAGAVLLVPLLAALFGVEPSQAWPWVAALVLVTLAGWAVDWLVAGLSFDLGFGLLDTGQHAVADRVAQVRLGWFTGENTATTRQAIASTGPDLVGLLVYMVTPLISAVLLPLAIAIAVTPIAWQLGVAALAGVPVLLGAYAAAGRLGRSADR